MLTGMKQDMKERFDTLSGHLDIRNDSVSGLSDEVTQLTREVEEVKIENEQLKTEKRELTDRQEMLKRNVTTWKAVQRETA